ncbi:MAG TPA: hypothetical protein VGQ41_00845 [Pyrinomonadaceae bacterium]|nr:hypothetical protein [Pyrinomonadaceae bacterium]
MVDVVSFCDFEMPNWHFKRLSSNGATKIPNGQYAAEEKKKKKKLLKVALSYDAPTPNLVIAKLAGIEQAKGGVFLMSLFKDPSAYS